MSIRVYIVLVQSGSKQDSDIMTTPTRITSRPGVFKNKWLIAAIHKTIEGPTKVAQETRGVLPLKEVSNGTDDDVEPVRLIYFRMKPTRK